MPLRAIRFFRPRADEKALAAMKAIAEYIFRIKNSERERIVSRAEGRLFMRISCVVRICARREIEISE
jgi:hypothetical protein